MPVYLFFLVPTADGGGGESWKVRIRYNHKFKIKQVLTFSLLSCACGVAPWSLGSLPDSSFFCTALEIGVFVESLLMRCVLQRCFLPLITIGNCL